MESIKQSISELTEHFNTRMAEFQQNLQNNTPATSPSSNITGQFTSFRSFVLAALEALQLQVKILDTQHDHMEMRTRRKILLLHGIPEANKENVSSVISKVLSEHLQLHDLGQDAFSRCLRKGLSRDNKPRPIVVKFRCLTLRNQIWFSKSAFKGSGITVTEFLTKQRHETFLAARQRYGTSKSWTKDGYIFMLDSNGKRHRISSMLELKSIPCYLTSLPTTSGQAISSQSHHSTDKRDGKLSSSQAIRSKRNIKKLT